MRDYDINSKEGNSIVPLFTTCGNILQQWITVVALLSLLAIGLTFEGRTFSADNRVLVDVERSVPMFNLTASNCANGPYIWVRGTHDEGIGATMRYNHLSYLLANALRAKMVINLVNLHTGSMGDISEQLGIDIDEACSENDLNRYRNNSHLQFLSVEDLLNLNDDTALKLCEAYKTGSVGTFIFTRLNLRHNSVVVFEQINLRHVQPGCIESCMYSDEMLVRYRYMRARRGVHRPSNENWISVHFRWGDVGSSLNHTLSRSKDVDYRTGGDLNSFLHALSLSQKKTVTGRLTKLFFFTEAEGEDSFAAVLKEFPNVTLHTDSTQWLQALDLMSLSGTLIGGRSSFFSLATNLCDDCVSISLPSNESFKFPEQRQASCSSALSSMSSRFWSRSISTTTRVLDRFKRILPRGLLVA